MFFAVLAGGASVEVRAATTDGAPTASIVFESDRDGGWNLYLTNADGSGTKQLTTHGGEHPAVSPDGTRIAFTRNGAIYTTSADGIGEHRIGAGADPAWSHDGARLAFERGWQIYVANADGTGARRLTTVDRNDINTVSALPSWSPDDSRLAFERLSGTFVIGSDGAGLRRLTKLGVYPDEYARPKWSPDGTWLAFETSVCCAQGGLDGGFELRERTPRLHVFRLADGATRVLASDVGDGFAWSPDGSTIAYSRSLNAKPGSPSEIFTTDVRGGSATRVTWNVVGESSVQPDWSPDGAWLSYARERFPAHLYADSADIAVVRSDGTGQRQLTLSFPEGGSNDAPAWAPGSGLVPPDPPPSPTVEIPARGLSRIGSVGEIAASGSHAAFFTGSSDGPLLWEPKSGRLTIPHASGLEYNDFYGLVLTGDTAAWFAADAHGVIDPETDVSLVLTEFKTQRSHDITSVYRSGHHPSYDTGPRLAGDGSLLAYNAGPAGGKLFLVDTRSKKPRLRLIARNVAVADVDRGRIAGWRGASALVTISPSGRLLGTAPMRRSSTRSVVLAPAGLFTTSGSTLSQSTLNGQVKRTWPLVDEGGGPAVLRGVEGDIAVYVSGVAVHLLRLSTGNDVVLTLEKQGDAIDVSLTPSGLFYGYDKTYSRRLGQLGYVAMRDISAEVP